MKRVLIAVLAAACATGTGETKPPPATAAAAPAATSSPQPAPAPQTTPPAKEAPKASPEKVATGTAPAAEAPQQTSPPPAAPEPPLMPDQAFRAEQPKPLPVQPHFAAPVPVQKKLKNGARVLIVENHQVPLVAVDVRFLHGVDADPKDRPGLAEFVADTVDEGTRTRPAQKLAEAIEDLAAHLGAGASLEGSAVHLNCLSETLPQALELLADVVQNPAFRPEDVERVRVLRLTALEQKRASLGALANDEADRILFGPEHPWGKPSGGTPESAAATTPADLAKFHDTWWVPNDAVISVSGDVKVDEIVKLLDEKFAGWKPKKLPALSLPPLPKLSKRSIVALEKPTATQSQVWVIGHLFKANDPEAVALRVANLPLGGMFTSRLNMNLREKHGYSYGVRSGVSLMRDTGTFAATGGIIAKNTVEAVAEYENELKKFSDGEVSDVELANAKETMIRGLPASLETNDAVSSAMGTLVSLGLPLDYYKSLPGRITKITKGDVKRVVTKWIKPDKWPVVIVGPVGQSKTALEKLDLGPVTIAPAPGVPPKTAAAK
ncbi:MAG: M16 family metallopeptidase [Myxococcales bacterium]|nr:insulinase family protein [Myxococcales bacterium]